jgi:lysophospholipase L1-like esterase
VVNHYLAVYRVFSEKGCAMMTSRNDQRGVTSHGLIRRLLTLAGGLVLVLLVAELALRLFWPQVFTHHAPGMYTPHPELGHVLTPSFEGEIQRSEFRFGFQTNEAGMRGPSLRPLTESTVRILCLGDSLGWGMGVEYPQTYPARLESLLHEQYPRLDIQVLNASTPQYGTLEELAYLEWQGEELHPDVVIVHFNTLDDFEQNRLPSGSRHEFRDNLLWHRESYSSTIRPPIWRFIYWLKHHSHLAHLASERAGSIAMRAGVLTDWERASSSYFTAEDSLLTEGLLTDLGIVAKRLGASTVLLYTPEKMQVLAGVEETRTDAQVVASAADRSGAAYLDLTHAIVTDPEPSRFFFVEEGHWTAAGHELVASHLADEIVTLGLLEEKTSTEGRAPVLTDPPAVAGHDDG